MLDALQALNRLRREVFVLRFIQQESYENIAEHLGKTAHQVRGLCCKAVEQVRSQIASRQGCREQETHARD